MESSSGEQWLKDDTEPQYQLPKPRPTSIFMSNFEFPGTTETEQTTAPPLVPRSRVETLYRVGARIWTKQDFHGIEEHVKALVRNTKEPKVIPFRCIDDSIVMVQDLNPRFAVGKPIIDFRTYQDLLYSEAEVRDKNSMRGLAICSQGTSTLPTNTLTEFQLLNLWLKEKAAWDESKACADLKLLLSTSALPMNTKRIVCFGLGNLETQFLFDPKSTHHRSIVQHCAALTIATAVSKKVHRHIQIYAQDPEYSIDTKRILARQEIKVIDCYGAEGFTYVDDDAFVFTVSPNVPVKQVVADLAKPTAMIWEKVSTPEEEEAKLAQPRSFKGGYLSPWTTDNDSPRTQELVKGYKEAPFPGDKDHFTDSLTVYIRKD
ncbi:hypothetical protein F5X99DRAFT_404074 [Biscogniauxia marginata]|nr:hypothetical protein F5X99DRAFT_404074 [Biscogniauxia marginata]